MPGSRLRTDGAGSWWSTSDPNLVDSQYPFSRWSHLCLVPHSASLTPQQPKLSNSWELPGLRPHHKSQNLRMVWERRDLTAHLVPRPAMGTFHSPRLSIPVWRGPEGMFVSECLSCTMPCMTYFLSPCGFVCVFLLNRRKTLEISAGRKKRGGEGVDVGWAKELRDNR